MIKNISVYDILIANLLCQMTGKVKVDMCALFSMFGSTIGVLFSQSMSAKNTQAHWNL